jgi:HTH-type transcriptional regulator/antitoxin HigA
MDITPIRTDADHRAALATIDRLWHAPAGSEDADRLDILATLVERYESDRYPVGSADPIEALKAHMAWTDRTQADLAEVLGSRARASEILSRKRSLNLDMIRRLHTEWRVPLEALIGPYPLAAAS